jgi:hypothetical protein
MAELTDAIVSVRRSKRPGSATTRVAWGWIGVTTAILLTIGYVAAYSVGMLPWPSYFSGAEQSTPFTKPKAEEARRKAEQEAAASAQAEEARRGFTGLLSKLRRDADICGDACAPERATG